MGAVSLAEVATVLLRNGRDPHTVLDALRTQIDVRAFTDANAPATAQLYPLVSAKGLPPCDRAGLAVAQRHHAPPVTAEHLWAEVNLDIAIDTIRSHQR